MKILIAADLHWPVINGVSTFSRNLAKGLAARGHDVLVIAPSQKTTRYKEIDENYVIERTISVKFPFYQNIRVSMAPQLEVKKIIDDFKPDVIHIQMLMWIGQATMSYARKKHIPVVSTSHAMPENLMDNITSSKTIAEPINYLLRDYGRRFHSRADVATSPTQSAIDTFGKHAERFTKPMLVISNGINLEQFSPGKAPASLYKKFSIPQKVPIVTYIGRVDAEKHIHVLLKAFATVVQKVPASHLVIVGHGTEFEAMKELADKLAISESVTFTGRVSDEDLVLLHRIGTLYAIPSPAELQSIATLEAMASGQPIVAVDAGALGELCHDSKNGYLFGLDDHSAMAESIVKILTDTKKRTTFSKESMRIAGTHDLTHTLEQFEVLYRRVIKDKSHQLAKAPKKTLGIRR